MNSTVRVKICGITSAVEAAQAAAAGADAIGLVFFAASPRHLGDLAQAREIALAVGPFVTVVGLFVDPAEAYVYEVLDRVPLSMLQFHGAESNEECIKYRRPYLKALRMKPGLNVEAAVAQYPDANGMLLDAYRPGVPGGTGDTFDWTKVPRTTAKPLVLAGGLNPGNIGAAVASVRPWAVDVSGGVERSPGVKCPDLVRRFVCAAKTTHKR